MLGQQHSLLTIQMQSNRKKKKKNPESFGLLLMIIQPKNAILEE